MFTKSLMISGLKRQNNLLNELIGELENRNSFNFNDHFLLEQRAVKIANNLRELRKIKDQYAVHLDAMMYLD